MGAHEKFKDIKGSNQKPRIEGLTIQYNGKEKGQRDKEWSTKYYKDKD